MNKREEQKLNSIVEHIDIHLHAEKKILEAWKYKDEVENHEKETTK